MKSVTEVKQALFSEIENIAQCPEKYSTCPGKDFTRKRKINIADLIRCIILMKSSTLSMELNTYFHIEEKEIPTVSAFTQQRNKLNPEAFRDVLLGFNSRLTCALYRDQYRLVAIDGTEVLMQRDPGRPETYSPKTNGHSEHGYNSVYVTALYDVVHDSYLDAHLQPGPQKNEYKAFVELIQRPVLCSDAIILADRGFACYNNFAHCIEKGLSFVIRAKDGYACGLLGVEKLPEELDRDIHIICSHSRSKKKHLQPLKESDYRFIRKDRSFDFIDDDHKEYELDLRIVRFPIGEDSFENIVTNLPREKFATSDLKDLYHRRWDQETSYRQLKHTVGLIRLHTKTFLGACQEIFARMVLYNVSSAIRQLAEKLCASAENRKTRYEYKINAAHAICVIHDYLRKKELSPPEDLLGLIARVKNPIRPNRHYARHHRAWSPQSLAYRPS